MERPRTVNIFGGAARVLVLLALALVACSEEKSGNIKSDKPHKTENKVAPVSKKPNPETDRIQKYAAFVRRDGETLELRVANGSVVKLTNRENPEAKVEEVANFIFGNFIERIGYFLIWVTFWESDGSLLVNAADGKKFWTDADPVFSPDYKRLVTTSFCDLDCATRIQVWRVTPSELILETTVTPELQWARAKATWETDDRIAINRTLYKAYGPDEPESKIVSLELRKTGWLLVGGR